LATQAVALGSRDCPGYWQLGVTSSSDGGLSDRDSDEPHCGHWQPEV
jgi:hypothetical protein